MFKKITNFFFEEVDVDDDEYVEEEYEEEELARPTIKTIPKNVTTRPTNIDVQVSKPKNETVLEKKPVKKEPFIEFYDVVEKPKRFIDIEEKAPPTQPLKPAFEQLTREKIAERQRNSYEFTSVISPMYGAKGMKNSEDGSDDAAPYYKKESVLGTVISPMYGKMQRESKKVETLKTSEVKVELKAEVSHQQPVVEKKLPPKFELDDIINFEKKEIVNENDYQFSLFENIDDNNESKEKSEPLDFDEFFNNH